MALTYPLSLSDFLADLPVSHVTFRLDKAETVSRTGGGEIIKHKLGARLWTGEIVFDQDYHRELAAIEAKIALLEGAGASFMIHDTRHTGPRADPTGTVLGAAAVKLAAVTVEGAELSLKGLPAAYTLSAGDYLGFEYAALPIRYALHRIVVGATADAGGTTPLMQVVPTLRPGFAVDATVTLVRPTCKARLLEADYGSGRSVISGRGQLSWTQTLR